MFSRKALLVICLLMCTALVARVGHTVDQRDIDGSVDPSQIPTRESMWILFTLLDALETAQPGKAKRFLTKGPIALDDQNADKLLVHARSVVQRHRASSAQDVKQLCQDVKRAKQTLQGSQAFGSALRRLQDKDDQRREQFIADLTPLLNVESERKVLAWAEANKASIKITELDAQGSAATANMQSKQMDRACDGAAAGDSTTIIHWIKEERP